MPGWRDYDGEGPDPDYGVFGDAGMELPPRPMPSAADIARRERQIESAEREARTSRDFNRYMIDLFNARTPKP